MKKIAVISSSPMMMMLALKLMKRNEVCVFDYANRKGGAWGWFDNYKEYVPRYSNAIVPLSKKEAKLIPFMNRILKNRFKIKIKQTRKKILINYPLKKKYIYDFSTFYKLALKKINFKKEFVSQIKILKNKKILLNNKYLFDKLYLPTFAGVEEIIKNGKIYKPTFRVIVSEHVSILAKKFKLKNFYYSDFYNDSFDRLKIEKNKSFFALTARLTFARKGLPVNKLKKYMSDLVDKKNIIRITKSKFKNYFRNKDEIILFKNIVKNSNIKYVDTTQFVCGFLRLRNFFKSF
jgi:hypothetical protein